MLIKHIYRCILIFCLIVNTAIPCLSQQLDLRTIDKLESGLFSQTFQYDTVDKRLDRIETSVFGRTYRESLDKRIKRLSSVSNNSNTKPSIGTNNRANINKIKEKPATDYPAITDLEIRIFKQNFNQDNIYSRLNRLEGKVFGTIFNNDSLSDRVDRLQTTSENYDDYPDHDFTISSDGGISVGSVYGNLSSLELNIFGRTFDNDLTSSRIERLEKQVFGACQSGMIDTRLRKLNSVAQSNFTPMMTSNFQTSPIIPNNQLGYNDSSVWNDSFFNDQPQMTTPRSGLLDIIGTLAITFLTGFLNKGENYAMTPPSNYYGYPAGYGYPYQNQYYPNYPVPWQALNGSLLNNYNIQSSPESQRLYNERFNNNFGAGVHILP